MRLIKLDNNYFLKIVDTTFATSATPNLSASIRHSLSIKNCQAIERGYDLDELADDFIRCPEDMRTLSEDREVNSFKKGFQKALELMGDKKFTEEDVRTAIVNALTSKTDFIPDLCHEAIQSLQQNEWDVEILMEEVSIGDKYTPDSKPKLDADGCLILKRVI